MKPRIFVSSTFYDLKYVREDLASFIRNYGFEPILFEEGDIGYDPGKPLDESCYEAMRSSDLAVLIIGGQYGSSATTQDSSKTEEFISITWREYKNAIEQGIPVFAFVDSKVHTEYGVYKENMEIIKEDNNAIKFRSTKNIKVFDFIQDVYDAGKIPVEEFTKVSEIKDFLSKQWSDMMKRYLVQRREKEEIDSIKAQIDKLESLVGSMSAMLDAVGKKVITESKEYDEVKIQQRCMDLYRRIIRCIRINDRKGRDEDDYIRDFIKTMFECAKISRDWISEMDDDIVKDNPSYLDNLRTVFIKNEFVVYFRENYTKYIANILGEIDDIESEEAKRSLFDIIKNKGIRPLISRRTIE